METMAWNTTRVLSGVSHPPIRMMTSICSFHAGNCCSWLAASKKQLSFRLWCPRKLGLGSRSSSSSFPFRGLSVTCGVTEISESQFSDVVLKSDRPVLVEFVADWCGPCRLMAPAIESIAQEYKEKLSVVKIDHDANPELIKKWKVYGLPTLILFKDGQEVPKSRKEGAIIKEKLQTYVKELLQSVSVA